MMDDREYAKHTVRRMKEYQKNNLFLGENLIITEETATIPLGTDEIHAVISRYFEWTIGGQVLCIRKLTLDIPEFRDENELAGWNMEWSWLYWVLFYIYNMMLGSKGLLLPTDTYELLRCKATLEILQTFEICWFTT